MFKNKLLQLGVILLVALALIAIVVVILMNTILKPDPTPTDPTTKAKEKVEDVAIKDFTAAELQEMRVVMDPMNGQLASGEMVMMNFELQLNTTEAKEEVELSKAKIEDIINQTLADLQAKDISGSKGRDKLKSLLINKINPVLKDGKVLMVYIKNLNVVEV